MGEKLGPILSTQPCALSEMPRIGAGRDDAGARPYKRSCGARLKIPRRFGSRKASRQSVGLSAVSDRQNGCSKPCFNDWLPAVVDRGIPTDRRSPGGCCAAARAHLQHKQRKETDSGPNTRKRGVVVDDHPRHDGPGSRISRTSGQEKGPGEHPGPCTG